MLNKKWWSPLALQGCNCQFLMVSFIFSTACKRLFQKQIVCGRETSWRRSRPGPGHSLLTSLKTEPEQSTLDGNLLLACGIHQTGFYMEILRMNVWFNLLLKPRTLVHLLEIPKENRDHERTKANFTSPTPLWWSPVIDATTRRTCHSSDGPQSQDPSRRTTPQSQATQLWSIRPSLPTTLPSMQRASPHDNERWSEQSSGRRKLSACLLTVKSESQWPYSAQHTHIVHTVEHIHNTPRTHRKNTHSTQKHTQPFSWE